VFEETPCDTEVGGSIYVYILYSGSSTTKSATFLVVPVQCMVTSFTCVWLVCACALTSSVTRTRVGSPTLLIGPRLRAQAMITNSLLKLPVAVSGRNKSYSSYGSGPIGCSAFGVASAVALGVVRVWFRQLCRQNPQPSIKIRSHLPSFAAICKP